MNYLLGYDSINIFRVWNSEKKTVSDYKDVIFDETKFYNIYKKADLLKKSEKTDLIEFQTFDFKPTFDPLNSDDEDWLKTSICQRFVPPFFSSIEGVRTVQSKRIDKNESSAPQTLKSREAF